MNLSTILAAAVLVTGTPLLPSPVQAVVSPPEPAYMLVLAVTAPSGDSDWSVLHSGISQQDCAATLAATPHELARTPLVVNGVTVELFCTEEEEPAESATVYTADQLAAILAPPK